MAYLPLRIRLEVFRSSKALANYKKYLYYKYGHRESRKGTRIDLEV